MLNKNLKPKVLMFLGLRTHVGTKFGLTCFMTTWIIFQNHLLEVGLTQKRETMAL